MGIKAFLSKYIAAYAVRKIDGWKFNATAAQEKVFQKLIKSAR